MLSERRAELPGLQSDRDSGEGCSDDGKAERRDDFEADGRGAEGREGHGVLGPGGDRLRGSCVPLGQQVLRRADAGSGGTEAHHCGPSWGDLRRSGATAGRADHRAHQGRRGADPGADGGGAEDGSHGGRGCRALSERTCGGALQAEDGRGLQIGHQEAHRAGFRRHAPRGGGSQAGHRPALRAARCSFDGESDGGGAVTQSLRRTCCRSALRPSKVSAATKRVSKLGSGRMP